MKGISIFATLISILVVSACGNPRDPANGGEETFAFVMCQSPVSAQLRAPSTAKFPFTTAPGVSSKHVGGGAYQVRGFVDAQNGFGAMIRTSWSCKIRENSDNSWSVENIKIDN